MSAAGRARFLARGRQVRANREMLVRVSEAQNWRCCWCGVRCLAPCEHPDPEDPERATREHLIPKSRGGGDEWENIVMACHACNGARSSTPWRVWMEAMAATIDRVRGERWRWPLRAEAWLHAQGRFNAEET